METKPTSNKAACHATDSHGTRRDHNSANRPRSRANGGSDKAEREFSSSHPNRHSLRGAQKRSSCELVLAAL